MIAAGRILVTGAEDAVGGRLLERLVLACAPVRAVVRHPAHALRPCRFGIEVLAVDPEDATGMVAATEGCDIVFACDDDRVHPERTAVGARHLVAACEASGVARLVAVSSATVYEPLPAEGAIDETYPCRRKGDPYHDALLAREEALLGSDLSCVVLQPGIVYGPHTPLTDQIAERLRWQRVLVTGAGEGTCNAIYLDDVVEAAFAAARATDACGRMLLAGTEPVPWRDLYDGHARALGLPPPTYVGDAESDHQGPKGRPQRGSALQSRAMTLARELRRRSRPVTKRIARRLGHQATVSLKRAVKRRLPRPVLFPDPAEDARYRSRAVLSTARARTELGWTPKYCFEEGMALTAQYLRWAYPRG